MNDDIHYTQIETYETDTIESVARRLVASAPASCMFAGVEIQAGKDQVAEDIVRKYLNFRQSYDVRKRLKMLAISRVEIVEIESTGPGKPIDPNLVIKNPALGSMYVLWERMPDFSIGTVGIVVGVRLVNPDGSPHQNKKGVRLHCVAEHTAYVLGSLLVEQNFRVAASEVRLEALEARLDKIEADKKSS